MQLHRGFGLKLTKLKHFLKNLQTTYRYNELTKSRKGDKIMSKFVEVNENIAEKVVGGYKKIEEGVVEGFGKVTDKCVETLFAKEGESVEDAKKRLSQHK